MKHRNPGVPARRSELFPSTLYRALERRPMQLQAVRSLYTMPQNVPPGFYVMEVPREVNALERRCLFLAVRERGACLTTQGHRGKRVLIRRWKE